LKHEVAVVEVVLAAVLAAVLAVPAVELVPLAVPEVQEAVLVALVLPQLETLQLPVLELQLMLMALLATDMVVPPAWKALLAKILLKQQQIRIQQAWIRLLTLSAQPLRAKQKPWMH
jgi:hypothetical protein